MNCIITVASWKVICIPHYAAYVPSITVSRWWIIVHPNSSLCHCDIDLIWFSSVDNVADIISTSTLRLCYLDHPLFYYAVHLHSCWISQRFLLADNFADLINMEYLCYLLVDMALSPSSMTSGGSLEFEDAQGSCCDIPFESHGHILCFVIEILLQNNHLCSFFLLFQLLHH